MSGICRQLMLCWAVVAALLLGAALPVAAVNFDEEYVKAQQAYEAKDWDTAITHFQRARDLVPNVLPVRKALFESLRQAKRYAEAENEARAMIGIDPSDMRFRVDLGTLLLEQGKYHEAQTVLNDVVGREPDNSQAHFGLAISHEGLGNLDTAAEHYEAVLRAKPDTSAAEAAKSRLARLKKAMKAEQTGKFFQIDPELGEKGLGWWDLRKLPISVYVDSGENVPGYRPEMRLLVNRALDAWTNASAGKFRFAVQPLDMHLESQWLEAFGKDSVFKRLGPTLSNVPPYPVLADMHIHWVENLGGPALGMAWTDCLGVADKESAPGDSALGVIGKAHIWIATGLLADGTPAPASRASASSERLIEAQNRMLQEVITHEIGHALGLSHSNNPNDVMAAGIFGLNAVDLPEARPLSPRDIKALAEHYQGFQRSGLPAHVEALVDGASDRTVEVSSKFASESGKTNLGPGWVPGLSRMTVKPSASRVQDIVFDINAGNYDKSLAKLEKLMAENPSDTQARYLFAVVLVHQRQYARAAEQYNKVIELAPDSPLASLARAGLKKIAQ